jgi:hypothetical protein
MDNLVESVLIGSKYILSIHSTNIEDVYGHHMINMGPILYVKLGDSDLFKDEMDSCGWYDNTHELKETLEQDTSHKVAATFPCMNLRGTIIVDADTLPNGDHTCYYGVVAHCFREWTHAYEDGCIITYNNPTIVQRFIPG